MPSMQKLGRHSSRQSLDIHAILLHKCRCSSMAEHRFCKAAVGGSIPLIGSLRT